MSSDQDVPGGEPADAVTVSADVAAADETTTDTTEGAETPA